MIQKYLFKLLQWVSSYPNRMMERDESDASDLGNLLAGKRVRNRTSSSSSEIRSQSMTFNLYAAQGGSVIETHIYDEKTDRVNNTLYVIPEGGSFGTTLEEIVTLERLKAWH